MQEAWMKDVAQLQWVAQRREAVVCPPYFKRSRSILIFLCSTISQIFFDKAVLLLIMNQNPVTSTFNIKTFFIINIP